MSSSRDGPVHPSTPPNAKRPQLRSTEFNTAEKHAELRSSGLSDPPSTGVGAVRHGTDVEEPIGGGPDRGNHPVPVSGCTGGIELFGKNYSIYGRGSGIEFSPKAASATGDELSPKAIPTDVNPLVGRITAAVTASHALLPSVLCILLAWAPPDAIKELYDMCAPQILGDVKHEILEQDDASDDAADGSDSDSSGVSLDNEAARGQGDGGNCDSMPTVREFCPYCTSLVRASKKPPNGWCWAKSAGFLEGILGPESERPGEDEFDSQKWNGETDSQTASSGGDGSLSSDDTPITKAEMLECRERLEARMVDYTHRTSAPQRLKHCTPRQKRLVWYLIKLFREIYGNGERGVREVLPKCCLIPIRRYWPDNALDEAALAAFARR